MLTAEEIKAEIDNVSPEHWPELYSTVKQFARRNATPSEPTFMAKLRSVRISAPPDFSENIDLYLNGEKAIE